MAIGSENLELMHLAPKYARHIGSLVRRALTNDGLILELGSGDGFQTSFVMAPAKNLICIESDIAGREKLTLRGYQVSESLKDFAGGDISNVFSINCLEHIDNDNEAVNQVNDCLKTNGKMILFVPAFNLLYSSMDTRVGHFRRYSRRSIRKICKKNGFCIEKFVYVDSLGALATILFKISRNQNGMPSEKSLQFYDTYAFPISRIVDKALGHIFGKNIFLVARKVA